MFNRAVSSAEMQLLRDCDKILQMSQFHPFTPQTLIRETY